jgi:hypothetical protein
VADHGLGTGVPSGAKFPQRAADSLPDGWDTAWGDPSPFLRRQVRDLQKHYAALATSVPSLDRQDRLGPLVGSGDLRRHPVHRWYHYKEAYSPALPPLLRKDLAITAPVVADVFGGVATTALSLRGSAGTDDVISVEYSPFAQFAGAAKLSWPRLDPRRLRRLAARLKDFPVDYGLRYPSLAAFDNPDIFTDEVLAGLVSAREFVRDTDMRPLERDFFTLGLAAVVEMASGAMKDGRALRILRGRHRTTTSLTPRATIDPTPDRVRHLLSSQWAAMIEDLEALADVRASARRASALHVQGDARDLGLIKRSPQQCAFEAESIGWSCFSPPYLNCIDYSEVYKLELWLLEFVRTPQEFRELRLGTLRSHPSVAHPERAYLSGAPSDVVDLIQEITAFGERHGLRPSESRMISGYFDDMYRVFTQQMWVLKPGGYFACVVGNSTFSRRIKRAEKTDELWRLPVLTDLLLAHLARGAGFEELQLWTARDLRPRNVRGASARESIVVGRKPFG